MKPPNEFIDPSIKQVLDYLPATPTRSRQTALRGRAQFLNQADLLRQAVTPRPVFRHKSWLDLFQKKERWSMTAVAMVLLVLSLTLGGSGVTVFAAQEAMPNDPLYAIKLATEDARINMEINVQTRTALELDFANRRMQEVVTMAGHGIMPSDAVMERQRSQIEMALCEAAGMDDAAMTQILLRTQTMLREQLQIADQMRLHASNQTIPTLDQLRERLREQLQLTDLGLRDPQQFRTQMREATREQSRQPQHSSSGQSSAQSSAQQQRSQSSAQSQNTSQQQQQEQNRSQSSASQSSQSSASQQHQQSQSSVSQSSQSSASQQQQQTQSSAQSQTTSQQQQQSQSSASQQQQKQGSQSSSASSTQSGRR